MRHFLYPVFALAAVSLVAAPDAQAQKSKKPRCISDAEIEAVLGPQVRSGALLIDASSIDDGRPLCTGGTIARRIHRMREEIRPDERADRLDREERVRGSIAQIARDEEADRQAKRALELLEREARMAEARRDVAEADRAAAEARAGTSAAQLREARNRAALAEAELREARARRELALLPAIRLPAPDLAQIAADLDSLLRADDDSWWWRNDYAPRSVRSVIVSPFDASRRNMQVTAKFTYLSGGEGTVEVMYLGGELNCMRVHGPWSHEFGCRKPGNPESVRLGIALLDTARSVAPTVASLMLKK